MKCNIAPLPGFILDKIRAFPGGKASEAVDLENVDEHAPALLSIDGPIPEGSRNDTLFRYAAQLRSRGSTMASIDRELKRLNKKYCEPPLPSDEVCAIRDSIDRFPRGATIAEEFTSLSAETAREYSSKITTAAALHQNPPPPVKFVVDGLIPTGLTILSGDPKVRKSFMALDLGHAVATGSTFLGRGCRRCGVLYLALEDSLNRLAARGAVVGKSYSEPTPEGLYYLIDAPRMRAGLFDVFDTIREEHPGIGLIIVDTFAKIRSGAASKQEGVYDTDYREGGELKKYADKNELALMVVHHNNKKGSSDVIGRVSGTNGLPGAADTILGLSIKQRTDLTATLNVVGRDVNAEDLALRFNSADLRWHLLGNQKDVEVLEAAQKYENDPIIKTLRGLLHTAESWEGSIAELAGAVETATQERYSEVSLGRTVRALASDLLTNDFIKVETSRGTKKRTVKFYRSSL